MMTAYTYLYSTFCQSCAIKMKRSRYNVCRCCCVQLVCNAMLYEKISLKSVHSCRHRTAATDVSEIFVLFVNFSYIL